MSAFERHVFTITGTTANTSGTEVLGDVLRALRRYNWFSIHANLLGATGDTLDIYLQRKIDDDVWSDWLHFAQLAAAASAVSYAVDTGGSTTIQTVGGGTDASPTPALAASTFLGGHPGDELRCVAVSGASVSAGAAQTIYVVGWRDQD